MVSKRQCEESLTGIQHAEGFALNDSTLQSDALAAPNAQKEINCHVAFRLYRAFAAAQPVHRRAYSLATCLRRYRSTAIDTVPSRTMGMFLRLLAAVALLAVAPSAAGGQDDDGFAARSFKSTNGVTMR
jgi:hypothetical protein